MNFAVVQSQFFPLLINGLALGFIYVLLGGVHDGVRSASLD